MEIKYKIRPIRVPYCGECEEKMGGNGTNLPYSCRCGEWEFDSNSFEAGKIKYILKK